MIWGKINFENHTSDAFLTQTSSKHAGSYLSIN